MMNLFLTDEKIGGRLLGNFARLVRVVECSLHQSPPEKGPAMLPQDRCRMKRHLALFAVLSWVALGLALMASEPGQPFVVLGSSHVSDGRLIAPFYDYVIWLHAVAVKDTVYCVFQNAPGAADCDGVSVGRQDLARAGQDFGVRPPRRRPWQSGPRRG